MVGEQRRRGERRRERDRHAFRRDRGQAAERAPQRRHQQEDPHHGCERQLPAWIVHHPWVDREGDRRGQQQGIPARGRPPGAERDQARGSHRPRPLEGWAGARERHVHRDQHEHRGHSAARADPHRPEQWRRERAQEHHVLPADREHMCQPGAPVVVPQQRIDPLVLAQDHPARDGGLLAGRARVESGLSAAPHPVDQAGRAAARSPGGPDGLHPELDGDPVPSQVGRPVEPLPGFPARFRERPAHLELGAGLRLRVHGP